MVISHPFSVILDMQPQRHRLFAFVYHIIGKDRLSWSTNRETNHNEFKCTSNKLGPFSRTSSLILSDSKVHVANIGPTWVLAAPGGPHVGPMNLAISASPSTARWKFGLLDSIQYLVNGIIRSPPVNKVINPNRGDLRCHNAPAISLQ